MIDWAQSSSCFPRTTFSSCVYSVLVVSVCFIVLTVSSVLGPEISSFSCLDLLMMVWAMLGRSGAPGPGGSRISGSF